VTLFYVVCLGGHLEEHGLLPLVGRMNVSWTYYSNPTPQPVLYSWDCLDWRTTARNLMRSILLWRHFSLCYFPLKPPTRWIEVGGVNRNNQLVVGSLCVSAWRLLEIIGGKTCIEIPAPPTSSKFYLYDPWLEDYGAQPKTTIEFLTPYENHNDSDPTYLMFHMQRNLSSDTF